MEKKFDKLLIISKALESHQNDVARTFEFDLFRETNWFLAMNGWDESVQIEKSIVSTQKAILPIDSGVKVNQLPKGLIKVMFVGDTYKGDGEDLLQKMIKAMKLETSEYLRLPLDPEFELILDLENNILNPHPSFKVLQDLIEIKQPDYIVSLGAVITNLLLGRREKMSTIHGRTFELSANSWQYKLMPIFHPDFLIINPNMKRTTWNDLQLIMEYFGQN